MTICIKPLSTKTIAKIKEDTQNLLLSVDLFLNILVSKKLKNVQSNLFSLEKSDLCFFNNLHFSKLLLISI